MKFARGRTRRRKLLTWRRVRYTPWLYAKLLGLLGLRQMARLLGRMLFFGRRSPVALKVPGIPTPVYCRADDADHWVLWQIFGEADLDVELPEEPKVIVDGGANVGYSSLYLANRYPLAQIIAVEPDPDNCALFKDNLVAYPNVRLLQGALWAHHSRALRIENPEAEGWVVRIEEVSHPTEKNISAYTLGDVLALAGDKRCIDLLKLDIEGAEEHLFSAASDLTWLEQVKSILIETHGPRRRKTVLAATREQGFSARRSGAEYLFLTR